MAVDIAMKQNCFKILRQPRSSVVTRPSGSERLKENYLHVTPLPVAFLANDVNGGLQLLLLAFSSAARSCGDKRVRFLQHCNEDFEPSEARLQSILFLSRLALFLFLQN